MNFFKNLFWSWNSSADDYVDNVQLDVNEEHIHYSNEIYWITKKVWDMMELMNEAMSKQDYDEAESVRLDWLKLVDIARDELDEVGDFKWNSYLLDSAIKYLHSYKTLLENGYKKLIELRKSWNKWTPEEQKQLKENNEDIALFTEIFNDSVDEFVSQYDSDGNFIESSFENPFLEQAKSLDTSSDPLFEPIHGISLQDYAEIAYFMANWWTAADVCKILNIEMPVFDEANALWLKRMTEDKTFMVSMKYAEYFGQAGQNNKFLNFKNGNDNSSDDKNKFLKRLENDQEFYYELMWAREAAYDFGLDWASWIEKNFWIWLWEFQNIAMKWMQKTDKINEMLAHKEAKYKEYYLKLSRENNEKVADDIEF